MTPETVETDTSARLSDTDRLLSVSNTPERTFDGFEDYTEESRYWVQRPYAYVSILHNDEDNDRVYYCVEPKLDDYEEVLRQELSRRLKDRLMYTDVGDGSGSSVKATVRKREGRLLKEAISLAGEYGVDLGTESLHRVLYYLERDFVHRGPIEPIMRDPAIEDISCDGIGVPIFVHHRKYEDLQTNVVFDDKTTLNEYVTRLAERSGKHISASNPLVDASLPDGSRAQLSLGDDVTTRGPTFTIRKFQADPLTPVDLIEVETFTLEQMSYLWLAIENDMSLIFAGGTASGKTTSMNAISLFIPPNQKVVSIEDTREVTLPHENWNPMVTRDSFGAAQGDGESNEVDMYDLLETGLRQRPEYILVGEVRGDEAMTLFQAMNTGHTTYSTMHADSVDSAVRRLENPPINVPTQLLEAVDIISIQKQVRVDGDRVRRNMTIAETGEPNENNNLTYDEYFNRPDATEDVTEEARSKVFDKISKKTGTPLEEIQKERERREEVLQYLLDNDIRSYEDVSRTIQAYMMSSERVLNRIRNDCLDPDEFEVLDI